MPSGTSGHVVYAVPDKHLNVTVALPEVNSTTRLPLPPS